MNNDNDIKILPIHNFNNINKDEWDVVIQNNTIYIQTKIINDFNGEKIIKRLGSIEKNKLAYIIANFLLNDFKRFSNAI